MLQAVLAIEDRRFYEHPGVDPIGIVGAVFSNLRGKRAYIAGASTITQQLVRNVFLPQDVSGDDAAGRAASSRGAASCSRSWVVAHPHDARVEGRDPRDVPERHAARPARLVRDRRRRRRRRGCSSARTSATSRSPKRRRSPASSSRRRRCRRSTTRRAAGSGATSCCRRWSTPATSRRTSPTAPSHEPLAVVQRALEAEAPYFVDFVGQTLAEQYPGLTTTTDQAVDVYTTLDLHLQRLAQDAVRDGLTQRRQAAARAEARQGRGGADRGRSADRRDPRVRRRPLVQPVAVQPRDRLAPAAGIGLQAVRLPDGVRAGARRRAAPTSRRPRSPTTSRRRSSSTIRCGRRRTTRTSTTARSRSATRSPTRATSATIHVAQAAGYDHVAALWKRLGVGNAAEGVSVDRARRLRGDAVRDRDRLHAVPERRRDPAAASTSLRITRGGKDVTKKDAAAAAGRSRARRRRSSSPT